MSEHVYLTPPKCTAGIIEVSDLAQVREVIYYEPGGMVWDLYFKNGRVPDGMFDGWSYLCGCASRDAAIRAAKLLTQALRAAKGED